MQGISYQKTLAGDYKHKANHHDVQGTCIVLFTRGLLLSHPLVQFTTTLTTGLEMSYGVE
jgi:hypothetical protein